MRLQILELPVQHLGSAHEARPFVLVASEVGLAETVAREHFTGEFRDQIGAAGFLITSDVVEIGPA
jgi:adenosyl cobinamide kinase/adenosyl cobinamide phosphate guanylyltransferase